MRKTSLLIAIFVLLSTTAAMATDVVIVKPVVGITCKSSVWSPDGKSIAFAAQPAYGAPIIMLATPAGGTWECRPLVKDAFAPVWSPDSKQIACHNNGMVIVTVATGKVRRLSTDMPDNVWTAQAWSPNGRYLLYALSGIAGPREFVMDLKTGKNAGTSVGEGGAWTNAGKLISWNCAEGDAAWIKLNDVAGGASRVLLKGSCARGAFTPKGDAYAYLWLMPSASTGEGIYKIDLKSCKLAKMLALRSEEVIWSKDGTQFATVSKLIPKAGAEPEMNLYVGNSKNWYFKVVSKGLASPNVIGSAISWSPDGKSVACATADGGLKIVKL